ncbi:MAG: LysR family transcriptional regulator [Sphingomonas oligoaromativorans]|jgi:DNA-binding transcriptional LysR family regulator|uniref:LysR family transcriptional regulator n=1 Tax=Sphingomonas oligoaromativorans TaxID=575322 RepID=UPI00141EEC0F|nr:LysR family transcriptional regulator [Sphingomonas oligoaromativorans]NIJ34358.1 DNA-binding transcriptional LysR family regulator [Sphingomonas oligoaromativorans]
MDNRIGEMETFLAVARGGSFAAAAKQMRLTPSAVSRAIARLEARLGVVLIRRTTRALALTAEGEAYRDRVAGLVAEIDEIERSIGHAQEGPRGKLRVNASVPFGSLYLIPILPRFMEACPAVTLELALNDALVDLVEERADIAIRIGPLRDTRLKAKKLGRSAMVLVASPDYLAKAGEPRHPDDLDRHRLLTFSFRRSLDSWPFRIGGKVVQRPVEGAFLGNSGEAVRLMALAGGGIARIGRFHAAPDLAAGRLVSVLDAFNAGDGEDIHALYVGHERLSLRVRAFLDFLEEHLVLPG